MTRGYSEKRIIRYKKSSTLVAVTIALKVAVVCLFACFFSGDSRAVVTKGHVTVYHEGVGALYAELAVKTADRSFNRITDVLGHTPDDGITLILTRSREQFDRLTRGALPDWSSAVALSENRIVITPLEGMKINLERIIAHEIVHCIINDAAGDTFIPRWFHEGCAETLSGRLGIRDQAYLAWKVVRGNLLSFESIQRIFSSSSADAALAYDQSMIAVRHLMRVNGANVLKRIITEIKSGKEFPEAFYAATGLWPSEYESMYLTYLEKTYGRRSLITLVPGTWTFILILAMFVYIIKKIRNRRLLHEWEATEKNGGSYGSGNYPPDDY